MITEALKANSMLYVFLIVFFLMVALLLYQTLKEYFRPVLTDDMVEKTYEFRDSMKNVINDVKDKMAGVETQPSLAVSFAEPEIQEIVLDTVLENSLEEQKMEVAEPELLLSVEGVHPSNE